jgi:CrcB protein
VRHRFAPGLLLAVAIGGVAGTLLRAAVAQAVPPSATGFPWAILVVNLVGCAIVGFAIVAPSNGWLRAATSGLWSAPASVVA